MGTDPDDPENTTTQYTFDHAGRTVNEIVYIAGMPVKWFSATNYRTDDIAPGNIVGGGKVNLLGSGGSFETTVWSGGTAVVSDSALMGSKVMSVAGSSTAAVFPQCESGTYCLSAYVKGTGAKVKLSAAYMGGSTVGETRVIPLDDSWVRIYVTFSVDSTRMMYLTLNNSGQGTLYVDCVQLEKGDTPTTYNVLSNSGFDTGVSGWTGGSLSTYLINGYTCSIFPGASVSQTVNVGSVSEDTPFTVSGWMMAFSRLAEGEIKLTFNGTNTTSVSVPFNGFASGTGVFNCAQVLPPEGTGDISSVTFSVVNRSDSLTVYCDDLLLSFGNIARQEEDDSAGSGLVFHSNGDGTCTVTGIGTCTDTDLVIPDTSPAGDTVIEIDTEAFDGNLQLESVTIPDTLVRIRARAFQGCTNLKTANLTGSALIRIYDGAFCNCTGLEDVNIAGSVTRIDDSAFRNCRMKTLILPGSLDTLEPDVFKNCSQLEKITVPASLTEIPGGCFYGAVNSLKVYYEGSSSGWASVTKGTGALPAGCTVVCDTEVKNGSVYKYTYSGGHKTSVTVVPFERSSPVESYSYDADGNITSYTDSNGNVTSFTYDSAGNTTSCTTPGGRTTSYTYDLDGNVLSETDPEGNVTSLEYYDNGLLKKQSKGGTTVTYSYYNGLATFVTVTGTGYSKVYYHSYNDYGKLGSVYSGETVSSYTYTCGGRGKLKSKTEANGYTESYVYDSAGNLIQTKVSGNTVYGFKYDLSGSLLEAADYALQTVELYLFTPDGGKYVYTFDASGCIIKKVTGDGSVVFSDGSAYSELPEGITPKSETDTLGRETEYGIKLSQNNTETDVFSVTKTYIDGGSAASPNEVATEEFSNGGQFAYTYDNNGKLIKVEDNSNPNLPVTVLRYEYDAKGQLTREDNSFSGNSCKWTYDANGNIQSRTYYAFSTGTLSGSGIVTINYTYDSNNRDKLVGFLGTAISYSGLNPTNWRNASSLTWSGRQLTSRTYGGVTTTYEYNSDGLRTKKTTGTDVTEYVWEGGRLIREINPDRTITFLYDGDEIAGFSAGGSNYYYAKDSFGVISYVYNEDGSLYASYKYDAWGSLITSASTLPASGDINPIRYKSYYYDADTGFYYLQSRYYDPFVGRFLNADDAAYLGISGTVLGWNMFAYCENDAVTQNDPSGHSAIYLVSFRDIPVAGHAVLYYQFLGIWYKTQFAANDDQVEKGWKNTTKLLYISRLLLELKCYSLALFSLTFVGCTTATIITERIGMFPHNVMVDILKNNGINWLAVYLPGNFNYVHYIANTLNGVTLPYSLIYFNCAHYIELLLSFSPNPAIRLALRHQIMPSRLLSSLVRAGFPFL